MWRERAQRRANAASASPPRTPRAYGFTAFNNFSSFLRPLLSIVAHCVRLYPMPQPWMASATVGYGWIVMPKAPRPMRCWMATVSSEMDSPACLCASHPVSRVDDAIEQTSKRRWRRDKAWKLASVSYSR